jgi:hypothetical protein
MALRPTILRYKGKLRQIEKDKMAKVNSSMDLLMKAKNDAKPLPRGMFAIATGCLIFVMAPAIFVAFKNNVNSDYI